MLSNLLPPLRTRSGLPNPKSTPYTLKRLELPKATQLGPARLAVVEELVGRGLALLQPPRHGRDGLTMRSQPRDGDRT